MYRYKTDELSNLEANSKLKKFDDMTPEMRLHILCAHNMSKYSQFIVCAGDICEYFDNYKRAFLKFCDDGCECLFGVKDKEITLIFSK